MSLRLFGEDVLFLQRFLTSTEFYKDELDGRYGKNTDKALTEFEQKSQEIADEFARSILVASELSEACNPRRSVWRGYFYGRCGMRESKPVSSPARGPIRSKTLYSGKAASVIQGRKSRKPEADRLLFKSS